MAGNDRFPVGNRAWLGAGMMAAGLGAAVASGCGLATATAEETAGSAGTPRSTAEATQPRTSPMAARTAPTSAVRGPRTVLRGRTAAGAPLPVVRVEAVAERVADAADTSTDTGDGLIVDVHPDPESALCDGPQALLGTELRELASAVRRLPPVLGRVDASERVRKG